MIQMLLKGLVGLVPQVRSSWIICLVLCIISFGSGWYLEHNRYVNREIELKLEYAQAVQNARTKEQEWLKKSNEQEEQYKNNLASIQRDNDLLVAGLRKQLTEYAQRVSSASTTSTKPNGGTRESRVADKLGEVIEYSSRCAKRTDELIVQVKALQQFIKEERK